MPGGMMQLMVYIRQDYYLYKFIKHFNKHCKNLKNLKINSSSFNLKIKFSHKNKNKFIAIKSW